MNASSHCPYRQSTLLQQALAPDKMRIAFLLGAGCPVSIRISEGEALCKLEGFTYAPSDAHYWMHGHSTERDFIYVTTANLNHEQLQQLSDEAGAERSLLVLCTAFRGRGDYPNLTVKKIPKQVLSRCEWGHDDYSLQIENLPKAPLPSPLPLAGDGIKAKGRGVNAAQGGLFAAGEA